MTTTIQCDRDGERLDAALSRLIPGLTRSAAQRLLEGGLVTSGGAVLRKSGKTVPGLTVTVDLPDPQPVRLAPQDIPLDVRYEDDDLIVVNKPKGLVVHPAAGHPDGTLVNALLFHCGASLSGINGELRPGIVHRIDKDTSGLLVAAKTTPPIRLWQPSSPATACPGSTRPLSAAASGRTAERWTPPLGGTRPTGNEWPSPSAAAARR